MIDAELRPAAAANTPRGVADYFWEDARLLRAAEQSVLETFRRWGYGDVIPPMFEYAEIVGAGANRTLQAELYRFLDRDGSTLALRPDMTIAVARLVGARLHDAPMPQRFCYAGPVFRYLEPQAGRQREFFQAGIELIGAGAPQADAEVLALTARALEAAGLRDYRLVIGHLHFFSGLLDNLALTPPQRSALQRAVDRNSEAELDDFLRETPLRTQQRRTVEELPWLAGPDARLILDRAGRLCLNYAMHAALENLAAICASLDAYGLGERVYLDLTEINNLGYYTGITFEALAPGLGFPVAGGGRYDNLVGSFGPAQPAVGAALGLQRILLAAGSAPAAHAPADLLAAAGDSPAALALVEEWRSRGVRVAVELHAHSGAELWAAARRAGIPAALCWRGEAFDLYADPQSDAPTARVAAAADLPAPTRAGTGPRHE